MSEDIHDEHFEAREANPLDVGRGSGRRHVHIFQFRSHLVDRAWFLHQNYLAWWLQNGTLIPCLGNTNPYGQGTKKAAFIKSTAR
jgi:hypothetical protein